MSRYGQRSRLTGAAQANSINYWFGGGFAALPLIVDYLVVAGGAGSGGNGYVGTYSGGGGAGGLRSTVTATGGGGSLESGLNISLSTNYTVTVGAGGALVNGYGNAGNNGSNSVFSTITSTGGGGGAALLAAAKSGGSGGGGNNNYSAENGTTNQGYAGGSSSTGGGGGGAGGAGGTSSAGGDGGAGVNVSITGSSVGYAGGGASGAGTATAGGGNGSAGPGGIGANGTVNTGGGGGGGFYGSPARYTYPDQIDGSSGGSGIVILKYPDTITITIGAGLTGSTATSGSFKVTSLTAGTGNVSWA
jgi:hypothetical protein